MTDELLKFYGIADEETIEDYYEDYDPQIPFSPQLSEEFLRLYVELPEAEWRL